MNTVTDLRRLMDERILPHRNKIYGLCALWIIFFHISSRVPLPDSMAVLRPFIGMGNCAVDVFLFLSGYCACISWEHTNDTRAFYLKRVKRVVGPYLLMSIPFYLWKRIIERPSASGGFDIIGFVADISTAPFWLRGTKKTWFVAAILLFYLLVPFLYKLLKGSARRAVLLIAGIYSLLCAAYFILPIYELASIAYARFPIFVIGMAVYLHGDRLRIRHPRVFAAVSMAVFLFFTLVFPIREYYLRTLYQTVIKDFTLLWVAYLFLVPGALILGALIAKYLCRLPLNIIGRFGELSLEVYMGHVFLQHIKDFYLGKAFGGYWLYLLVPVLGFLIAAGCRCLYNKICSGSR